MEKKYIYANIRLPIEISDEGSFYEIHSDRMIIDFELCETLPEQTSYENQEMIAKIFAIHGKTEIPEKEEGGEEQEKDPVYDTCLKILKKELKNRTVRTRQNLSFRSRENYRRGGVKKFTRRVYPTNSNTSADDPIPHPELSVSPSEFSA
jgi:hypothetical protein